MLLATDLDGTFLGGTEHQRAQLYNVILANPSIKLVFVSGRGLQSILSLFNDIPSLPQPNCMICDVGATIVDGYSQKPIEPLQSNIENKWPGRNMVLSQLAHFKSLIPQQVPQERRCSFLFDTDTDTTLLARQVKQFNCDIIFSAGRFADVLPGGVNKGATLRAYIEHINYPENEVLVAGDTFNDLSLFKTGYKGVVVGNAEPGLQDATMDQTNTYHAKEDGAGGIIEAMRHFLLLRE